MELYGNAKEGMDVIIHIQGVFVILKRLVMGRISELNVLRLLILDGHGSHVIYNKSNRIG